MGEYTSLKSNVRLVEFIHTKMNLVLFTFTIVLYATINTSVLADLKLTLYYESLCPDCKIFVNDQLYPTAQTLGQHFDVEFKPFGFADWTEKDGGGYEFTCQHGPPECQGNLYQACLHNLPGSDQNDYIEIMHCIEGSDHPEDATESCMAKCNIISPSYEEVDECHKSIEGEEILHEIGVETKSLIPEVRMVPWVIFNGEWRIEWQIQAINNLQKLLCDVFLQDVEECKMM